MNIKLVQPKPPEVLYQYRRPTKRALDNLSRCVLHFSAPAKFDDPYDCGIVPRFGGYTEEDLQNFARRGIYFCAVPKMSKEMRDAFYASNVKRWGKMREWMRVACFSERNDNLLMWSHYSDGGEGFCIAFNTQKTALFNLGMLRKVKYAKKIPKGDSSIIWGGGSQMLDFWAHKSKDWEYEQEWRLFNATNDADNKEPQGDYAPSAIKAIYLGTKATDGTKERVRNIVKEKYPDTKLFEGKLSRTEYKVVFRSYRPKRT